MNGLELGKVVTLSERLSKHPESSDGKCLIHNVHLAHIVSTQVN